MTKDQKRLHKTGDLETTPGLELLSGTLNQQAPPQPAGTLPPPPPSAQTERAVTQGYPPEAGLSTPGQRGINIEKDCRPTPRVPCLLPGLPHQLLWPLPNGIPWALGQEKDAARLVHWSGDSVGLAVRLPHNNLVWWGQIRRW